MEEPTEESLDGSSIKPVSSLRSHFEQMANSKPSNNTTPRAISPKPQSHPSLGTGDFVNSVPVKSETTKNYGDSQEVTRGREKDSLDAAGFHSLRTNNHVNVSPSPARGFQAKPTVAIPPAVTIQPPQSPPKGKTSNLALSSTPTYLTADTPTSETSGGSSPRHFRIPSRPHTPLLESGKSPRLSASQPPSPPPPRRSGELRRDSSFNPLPPPVNRSEKPKIASKHISLGLRNGASLEASPTRASMDKSSPFSTPPSSDSSPEHELSGPVIPRQRHGNSPENAVTISRTQKPFEAPPIHHTVVSKRKDQELNDLGRGLVTSQITWEQRPALPTRPQVITEALKPRVLPPPTSMMPPPPPRPSMDRKRPKVNTDSAIDPASTMTIPKRVSSTPIHQLQTPPRSHGRSMTVDRTSDRVPAEFRTPLTTPMVPQERSAPSTHMTQSLGSAAAEYPVSSHSNRRPPVHKQGIREINCKVDAPRLMDVSGEYLCASGLRFTRIFSLHDGEQILSWAHTDNTKILSLAFKPTANVEDEGLFLWLGNNIGEIIEIDVAQQRTLQIKNSSQHSRRDVIKIHRYRNQMWTIDDSGMLHVWGSSNNAGVPNLAELPNQSFRLSKGHNFSMIVGDELWQTFGKDIRIYRPTIDASVQFQVLPRPLAEASAGDITCGTTISSQPDRVYFGHTDGKVSIYSRNYKFLGLVNISVYKVTSLVGVGGRLWASFSTGMIYVYDTTQIPWIVRKDWQAHQDPVVRLLANRSSFWTFGRSQIISLGQDNMLKVWDGLLQEDWVETQMQSQEKEYCRFNDIKALVMSWNAGAATPYNMQHSEGDYKFIPDLLQSSDSPDILIFGFQELVDLEDKTRTAKSFFKSKKKDTSGEHEHMSHQYRDWRDYLTRCLDDNMPGNELYILLHTANLVGLFTCIFVKSSVRGRMKSISAAEVKRGMGGLHGNKGALVIRFLFDDSSMCFINCHLAAGQTQTKDRNADITAILDGSIFQYEREQTVRQNSYVGGGDGTMILDHEICILNGDLNYRIDTMGRDTVVNAVKANNLAKLLERDQLLATRRKNPWFKLRAFREMPITFAPTYKYDVGTDNYDTSEKKRSPAWCDRILYRELDCIEQLDYRRHEVRVSDHRPVTARFNMQTKTVNPEMRAKTWEECRQQLLDMSERHGNEMMLDYLTNVLCFDAGKSKQLILQKQKNR